MDIKIEFSLPNGRGGFLFCNRGEDLEYQLHCLIGLDPNVAYVFESSNGADPDFESWLQLRRKNGQLVKEFDPIYV